MFFCFASIILMLWHYENKHQLALINKHTEIAAEQIRIRIEGFLRARMSSLELMTRRWVERRPADFSQVRFLQFSQSLYKHYPGYLAVHWIDPEGNIRFSYPSEADIKLKNKNIYQDFEPAAGKMLEESKTSGKYQISSVFKLIENSSGFAMCFPLIHQNTIQGYFLGSFTLSTIIEICLAKNIFDEFAVRIYENNTLIYYHGARKLPANKEYPLQVLRNIRFGEKIWRLEVEPKSYLDSTAAPLFYLPSLFLGIFFSLAISLLLYLLLKRLDLFREARDQAIIEVVERKRIEKRQKRLLEELSDKNEEMESFIYTVSHDLKTPIVTIDGFVEALREDYGNVIGKEGHHYLFRITEGNRRMGALISDLLELSRVGRTSGKKETISFARLVKNAARELQPQIKKRGIRITVDENLPSIFGEKKLLSQLVSNLVSNAIKYIGEDNPDPLIAAGVIHKEGETVYYIRDNGIGIDPRHFDKVFQVFHRLPGSKAIEGTGVGLAIAKRIVQRHGGKIWIKSKKNGGSTFFFTIKAKGD